ncbi:MAG: hypothetical protein R3F34_04260 [Planctomycetota bacterium]
MRHTLAALALLALSAPVAVAQTVDDVFPHVADAGDQIRLVGTNLGATSRVRFTALVGGFVGQWTMNIGPDSVSANEVLVTVPKFNSFVPENATPPSALIGSVRAVAGTQVSNAVDFGFLEQKFGTIQTVGTPGSDPAGFAPRIGFALSGGAPVTGNVNFRPEVTGAIPNAVAVLAIGAKAQAPYPILAGGDLVIDPFLPVTYLLGGPIAPPPTDHYQLLVPISGSIVNVKAVLQWVTIDPLTFAAAISDALVVQF